MIRISIFLRDGNCIPADGGTHHFRAWRRPHRWRPGQHKDRCCPCTRMGAVPMVSARERRFGKERVWEWMGSPAWVAVLLGGGLGARGRGCCFALSGNRRRTRRSLFLLLEQRGAIGREGAELKNLLEERAKDPLGLRAPPQGPITPVPHHGRRHLTMSGKCCRDSGGPVRRKSEPAPPLRGSGRICEEAPAMVSRPASKFESPPTRSLSACTSPVTACPEPPSTTAPL